LDRKIDHHRPISEVFERASPDPALTADFAAEIRSQFVTDGGGEPSPGVQCRDRICCVKAEQDAGMRTSLEAFHASMRGKRRLLGGASWDTGQVCFRVRRKDDPPEAIDIIRDAVTGLRKSGAVERCRSQFPQEGSLETRINFVGDEDDLEDAPLGVSLRVGGRLAGTPLGECFESELRRVLAAVDLPLPFASGVLFARFPTK
jgi:hypothetical protein